MNAASREYATIVCNDQQIIFLSALRRVLSEALDLTARDEPLIPDCSKRSFVALVAFCDSIQASYWQPGATKVKEKLNSISFPWHSEVTRSWLLQTSRTMLKGIELGHAARCGMKIGFELIRSNMMKLVEHAEDDEYGDETIHIDQIRGMIASHMALASELLQDAADEYVSGVAPDRRGNAIEVVCYDLTAPLLIVCPGVRTPLVSDALLTHQLSPPLVQLASREIPDLVYEATEVMLNRETEASEGGLPSSVPAGERA